MPTITATQASTENILGVLRTVDLSPEIEIITPGPFPLVQLLSMLRRRGAKDTLIRWPEDEFVPNILLVDATTGTGTTIDVDDPSGSANAARFLNVNDILFVTRTRELIRVTSITDDNTFEGARSWGTVAVAALADNDELINIGPAMPEGAAAPAARITVPVQRTNRIQEFRHSYQLTDTEGRDITLLTGSDLTFQRSKRLSEHNIHMEWAYWFGDVPSTTPTGDSPQASMEGVFTFLQAAGSETDAAGTLTEAEFNQHMEDVFVQGSSSKWHFASPTQLRVISAFGLAVSRITPEESIAGVRLTRYRSPFGDIPLVMEQLWGQSTTTDNYAPQRMGITLDMEKLWLRELAATTRRENIQNPSETRIREEYITKRSLELRNTGAHRLLVDVNA